MSKKINRGFTLFELIVVLSIVGVFCAIAVPRLTEVKHRNDLSDLTNKVQRMASEARSLAMRNRQAATLEYDGSTKELWINTLQGAYCWSAIQNSCVQNMGESKNNNDLNVFDTDDGIYGVADIVLCNVRAAIPNGSDVCDITASPLDVNSSFSVCFSGNAELWVRASADAGATCGATSALSSTRDSWTKTCASWAGGTNVVDGGIAGRQVFSGVVFSFNRFEEGTGTCDLGDEALDTQLDVTREVHVPSGSQPFSKMVFQ